MLRGLDIILMQTLPNNPTYAFSEAEEELENFVDDKKLETDVEMRSN